MKQRIGLAALCLLVMVITSGCVTQSQNPLAIHATTAVPGQAIAIHPATAGEQSSGQISVTLYFRYLDTNMLAPENRLLNVRRDESPETAIVRALAEGPSAGRGELKRLIPASTVVESVIVRDDLLFVTFNDQFTQDDIPADWAEQPAWQTEAPLRRMLTVQSIVATLTEWRSFTGVQILVHRPNEVQTNLRLEKQYFLTEEIGVNDPFARDESYLLTAHNTVQQIMNAWKIHDWDCVYQYTSADTRPSFESMTDALKDSSVVVSYEISPGTASADGQTATITLDLQTMRGGTPNTTNAYPLRLHRENGIWKIDFDALLALMRL